MKKIVLLLAPAATPAAAVDFFAQRLRSRGVGQWSLLSATTANAAAELRAVLAAAPSKICALPLTLFAAEEFAACQAELQALCQEFPASELFWQASLLAEPLLEDICVERLAATFTAPADLPAQGQAIETRSHQLIEPRLALADFSAAEAAVAKRVVHATAEFSFIETLSFHPEATARALAALQAGKPVFCDVNMLKNGLTHLPKPARCVIGEPAVKSLAAEKNCTRAAAAIDFLAAELPGAILVVGNAPTALWRLLELDLQPAVVIGLPVGLVGAREAKQALIASDLCHIANVGPRGGSPAAAAALNALAKLATVG